MDGDDDMQFGRSKTLSMFEAKKKTTSRKVMSRLSLGVGGGVSFIERSDWDMDALAMSLGSTVHIKGFAQRVDFTSPETMESMQRTLAFINQQCPDALVWDGDNYAEDSFTRLVPKIYHQTHTRLIMFLKDTDADRERATSSWTPTTLPIECYLCRTDLEWDELGVEALKATQSRAVVCFGGGGTVKDEFAKCAEDVMYFVAHVTRTTKAGDAVERPSLSAALVDRVALPNLVDVRRILMDDTPYSGRAGVGSRVLSRGSRLAEATSVELDGGSVLGEAHSEERVTEMKVTAKTRPGAFLRAAKASLTAEDSTGAVNVLRISALGDAINTAAYAAAVLEQQRHAQILAVRTTYLSYNDSQSQQGSARKCPGFEITLRAT